MQIGLEMNISTGNMWACDHREEHLHTIKMM